MGDAFPISGNIDPSSFPFLLVSLHQQGATGSLKVDGPNYQKALYFRGGRVLFGSSNDPRDQLGAILVESGRLTPEQLEDVNAKVGPGSPLAKVLAESGFVSQRELSEAARTKVELILADVLAYESGSFEFEDGVLPKGAVDLKLHPERLFLAATRRVTERGFVLRHLGGLDRVLRLAGDDGLREDLRPDCGGLLEVLDGSRTLKDATALTRLDEFEAAKLACGLLFLGLAAPASGTAKESPETFMALDDEGGFELPGPVELGTAPVASPLAAPPPPDEEQPLFLVPPAGPSAAPDLSLPPVGPPPGPAPPPLATPAPAPQLELPIEAPTPIAAPAPPAPRAATPPPAPPPRPASPPAAPQRTGAGPDGKLPLVPPPPRRPARPAPAEELPLRPAPPSKDDLAAVDALLHSRSVEPPLSASTRPTPPPARSPAWEPRFAQAAKPARQRTGLSPLLIGTIAVLLAVAGVAAWYLWLRQPAAARPGARPATTAPTVAAAAPSAAPATPAPAATPEAPASLAPTPSAPASATPSATPAATPVPTARPSAPPPTAPPAGGSLADARAALRAGAVARAGQLFAAALRSSPHGSQTVQLLVACSDETVGKAQAAVASDQLFVVPVTFNGRACQRLCWGVYDSPARAQAALASVPAYFREGGAKPKAMALAEILP